MERVMTTEERELEWTGNARFTWRLAWLVLRLVAVVLLGATSSTFVYRGF